MDLAGILERVRPREGWGIFLLTMCLVFVMGTALSDTGWTPGMSIMPSVSLGAFVIGLMIARSRLPGFTAHTFSLIIGFAWSFRMAGTTFPESYTWLHRWSWMWWRLFSWVSVSLLGGTSADNLVFILQMAFVNWVVTYLTVWFIFRKHKVWYAIIVGGVLMVLSLSYAPNNLTPHLVFYLGVALLLVIRSNLFAWEQDWRRANVLFNPGEVAFDFWRTGLILVILIVTLAWLAPSGAVAGKTRMFDSLRGPWNDLRVEWNRVFSSLQGTSPVSADFSGKTLELGGARDLKDIPVFEVRAAPGLRYWRMVVFDTFNDRTWENSDREVVRFGPGYDPLPVIEYSARRPVSQTVTSLAPNASVLAMAGQPYWVNKRSRATLTYVSPTPAPESTGDQVSNLVDTISFARSRVPFRVGDLYVVSTLETQASIRQLRTAGEDYPTWIVQRYLALPEGLPPRVVELAQGTTTPFDNVYDRATVIESYLREEITYNENIDAPPGDRDVVDYLLFESRQGYCDYYATAMVVMLRSVGIPARLASGYSQGDYQPEKDTFLVLQSHAHSWVEVFFPHYGWIEFEPTSAEPPIIRPVDTGVGEPGSLEGSVEEETAPEGPDRPNRLDMVEDQLMAGPGAPFWAYLRPSGLVLVLIIVLLVAFVAVLAGWLTKRRRFAGLGEAEAIYLHMLYLAALLGQARHEWQTPLEHASALGRVVPEAEHLAWQIARIYTRKRYTPRPLAPEDVAGLHDSWQALRPVLRRAVVRYQLARHVPLSSKSAPVRKGII